MDKDRYIVIQEWMLDYPFTLAELTVYALISGFCQDGESDFHGSVAYVAKWCKLQDKQTRTILKKLTESGYLIKTEHPGFPAHYSTPPGRSVKITPRQILPIPPVNITDLPPVNITDDNKVVDNKVDNKDTRISPRTREDDKALYGQFVRLTPAEHDKLVAEYGADDTARMIEILDYWLADKKKDPYKSHYIAIKKWCYRALQEQKTAELDRQIAEQRLKNAQEAGQRVNGHQTVGSNMSAEDLARIRRFEEKLERERNGLL